MNEETSGPRLGKSATSMGTVRINGLSRRLQKVPRVTIGADFARQARRPDLQPALILGRVGSGRGRSCAGISADRTGPVTDLGFRCFGFNFAIDVLQIKLLG
jgi:hypothetical protein